MNSVVGAKWCHPNLFSMTALRKGLLDIVPLPSPHSHFGVDRAGLCTAKSADLSSAKPIVRSDTPDKPPELGADKTPAQHAGNVTFVAATVLNTVAVNSHIAQMVPGLNLVVAGIEGYNAVKTQLNGDHVVAMGHAGNATGCLSSFLGDAGRYTSIFGLQGLPPAIGSAVIGFGLAGGLFGVVQGTKEVLYGRSVGSQRTVRMGTVDFLSGALTLAGIGLHVSGTAPILGTLMMAGASVCDVTSAAIDYFHK